MRKIYNYGIFFKNCVVGPIGNFVLICSLIVIGVGCKTLYTGPGYVVHDDQQAMDFAWVFYEKRMYGEAERSAKIALDINSTNIDAYNLLGLIKLKNGSLEDSVTYLEKGRSVVNENKVANGDFILCKLGLVYLKLNEFQKALSSFYEAIAIKNSWQAELGVALSLWKLNKREEALIAVTKVYLFNVTDQDVEDFLNEFLLPKDDFFELLNSGVPRMRTELDN